MLRESIPETRGKKLVRHTTGATGYGGGRFVIHADGRVENLKPQTIPEPGGGTAPKT
jgi:hypothetical protein